MSFRGFVVTVSAALGLIPMIACSSGSSTPGDAVGGAGGSLGATGGAPGTTGACSALPDLYRSDAACSQKASACAGDEDCVALACCAGDCPLIASAEQRRCVDACWGAHTTGSSHFRELCNCGDTFCAVPSTGCLLSDSGVKTACTAMPNGSTCSASGSLDATMMFGCPPGASWRCTNSSGRDVYIYESTPSALSKLLCSGSLTRLVAAPSGTGGTTGGTSTVVVPVPDAGVPAAVCGNGMLESAEACDDGNAMGGDGCTGGCRLEANFVCPVPGSPCRPITQAFPVCGDGRTTAPETCDDGNTSSGDGCSKDCQIETVCVGTTCLPGCGDGALAATEECDDANQKDGDGCSSTCRLEAGWACATQTSTVCTSICGDGVVVGTEECDSGAANSDTGACTSQCKSNLR